jgi:peptidoglycan/xylan/chitin deacetylase (PgdA/CDA1 family)
MKALISLTFDDGLRCHFEKALPILDSYALPATFFLVANKDSALKDGFRHPRWKKTDWSKKDIRLFANLIQHGHEIGAHSVHHRHPFLDSDPVFEAVSSKKWIEDRLEVEIPSYSYPFCHYTEPIKSAVTEAGYKQARWGANEVYYPLGSVIDRFKIDCRLISKFGYERIGNDFIGHYGAEDVGGWSRPGCWHVLMFHGIGGPKDGWWPIPVTEFERQMTELAALRDSGSADVVTFKDGAQRFSYEDQS